MECLVQFFADFFGLAEFFSSIGCDRRQWGDFSNLSFPTIYFKEYFRTKYIKNREKRWIIIYHDQEQISEMQNVVKNFQWFSVETEAKGKRVVLTVEEVKGLELGELSYEYCSFFCAFYLSQKKHIA